MKVPGKMRGVLQGALVASLRPECFALGSKLRRGSESRDSVVLDNHEGGNRQVPYRRRLVSGTRLWTGLKEPDYQNPLRWWSARWRGVLGFHPRSRGFDSHHQY